MNVLYEKNLNSFNLLLFLRERKNDIKYPRGNCSCKNFRNIYVYIKKIYYIIHDNKNTDEN